MKGKSTFIEFLQGILKPLRCGGKGHDSGSEGLPQAVALLLISSEGVRGKSPTYIINKYLQDLLFFSYFI